MRQRRLLCLWFPRLASDRALRGHGAEPGPFAIVARTGNADRLACLNPAAEAQGLARGMTLADARALCPALRSQPAAPERDAALLGALHRWAGRFSPLVARDGADGLMLDIAGVAHLFGGEAALVAEVAGRLERAGLGVVPGLADTRGAAWALAHHAGGGRAAPGGTLAAIGDLPPAALRLAPDTAAALARLGLRRIRDLVGMPRATLARRFGAETTLRLDQALGAAPEPLAPEAPAVAPAVRLTLPEPIGLLADVQAGLDRLLARLFQRLEAAHRGARALRLELARVDRSTLTVDLRLARPLRDAAAIAALYAPRLDGLDAGFGIDAMRLVALDTDPLPPRQIASAGQEAAADRLADLVTRLANRLGFEALERLDPAESHIPERAVSVVSAAFAPPPPAPWHAQPGRPVTLFAPEPLAGPPLPGCRFRWRGVWLTGQAAQGPERIAPEWWFDDPAWAAGPRDYWQVETAEGPRLWAFHTPANGAWAVQGEAA
ncbi:MAG: Y-family DNA polymerase [Gemmobacter sp.]|uniref:Y-family DNA polymerase n=1 Tax=Gemmobacter sp. TaxID=1898957 RepID=UPI00391DB344